MKKSFLNQINQYGYVLVTLLVVMVVAVVISSAGISLIVNNTQSSSRYQQGVTALKITESGMENAILRILRDPAYSGETLSVGGNPVMITVVGSNPIQVTAQGQADQFTKQIDVTMSFADGVWTIDSWKETF